ncbi:subtilisin-like protease SBT5.6 isoform X2 [Ipomoea triloba]|uniref:subtilisin-like protease SBT5.6 isoform X2 n=1 Tax=Ipomoea triloba TaxID=35885 RepID=UPI00125E6B1C|nr:subtilisin-like protease SBT5.6 isoform X2 [Ipomoea triloba]
MNWRVSMLSKMKTALTTFLFLLFVHILACNAKPQVYVVYLGEHSGDKTAQEIEGLHRTYIHHVKRSKEEASASLVHSYKNIINGFSALLTSEEANTIAEMDGVISVFPSESSELHTTRSWDFINMYEGNGDPTSGEELLSKAGGAKDVIVGMVDTGIWPESQSFNDEGMEPVPMSWKGTCQEGLHFTSSHCNRKIIGARYHLKSVEAVFGHVNHTVDFRSARDSYGHGTHTASIVGGRKVANASAYGGFANGVATGGAPLTRLAIYKACWVVPFDDTKGVVCQDDDVLAAFDHAVADGVHVISVSLGFYTDGDYFKRNVVALGALHAAKRNIVVVCSAGNFGRPNTVLNVAPWIFTVGASTIDRSFPAPVVLGNNMVVKGESISALKKMETFPLVYAGDVEIPGSTNFPGFCLPDTLSPEKVKGKAVFCLVGNVYRSTEVERAGGAAVILGTIGSEVSVGSFLIPGTSIFYPSETDAILKYIKTNKNPVATLIPGKTIVGAKPSPAMAPFTSLGPSSVEPNILKPDITAPGFNILAAWSEASSPSDTPEDHRRVKYNIISGTSMSCPHVSAVAALLKAIHPDWSSAAIKSAIMTSATTENVKGEAIEDAYGEVAGPFHYGAGHIQPSKAADPGLVYDSSYTDYLLFICSVTGTSLDPSFKCPEKDLSPSNLNYPSLAIAGLKGSMVVKRTVTNVGSANATYSVEVKAPAGYSVKISPMVLRFMEVGEKQSFSVSVKAESVKKVGEFGFGWYKWSDGIHMVKSPIVVSSAYVGKWS